MEKANFEILKSPGVPTPFPLHSRSHLKSETFRTLVRILALGYDQPQLSHTTEAIQSEPKPELENALIQKNGVVDENIEAVSSRGTGFCVALAELEDELEHTIMVKGNEELVSGNDANLSTLSTEDNQNGDGVVLIKCQEQCSDLHQFLMIEDGNVAQLQVDNERKNSQASEAINLHSIKDITVEVSMSCVADQNRSLSLKKNAKEVVHDMQQKEMELEKSVCSVNEIIPCLCLTAEGDVEEGEISQSYDQSIDFFVDNAVALENKIGEEQVSKDLGAKEKDTESTFYFTSVGNVEDIVMKDLKKSGGNKMESKFNMSGHGDTSAKLAGVKAGRYVRDLSTLNDGLDSLAAGSVDPVSLGYILGENTDDNQENISIEKGDNVCNKKKRGPLSEERKEKRKRKKRIKRAEKNRQLGVKRLKLHPVLKPKPVTYCRHYLKGRCQKGGECKFSHDTVPLTKSSPCCYFARQACMKGDDCPFDHQLSKYPCNNYVLNGSCSRGDTCMFSHKILPKEVSPSATSVCKTDVKSPSLMGNSNSKRQLNSSGTSHQNVSSLPHTGKFPHNCTEQNVADTVLKAQAPKGISFISFQKTPLPDFSKLKQASSSLNRDGSATIGNQMNQSASDTLPNVNEKRTVAVAPKGINFIASNNNRFDNSSCKQHLSSLLSNGNIGAAITLKDDSSKDKQTGSSIQRGGVKVSNQANESATDMVQKLNQTCRGASPLLAPAGVNSLSFGSAPLDDSNTQLQTSLPSIRDKSSIPISIRDGQIVSTAKLPNSRLTPFSCQTSDQLVDGHDKNKSITTQKALLSTLAFAARFESEMKMTESNGASFVGTGFNRESRNSSSTCGSSQNESVKASTILDFLYGVNGKTKQ